MKIQRHREVKLTCPRSYTSEVVELEFKPWYYYPIFLTICHRYWHQCLIIPICGKLLGVGVMCLPNILTACSPNSHFDWSRKEKWTELGRWLMKMPTVVFSPSSDSNEQNIKIQHQIFPVSKQRRKRAKLNATNLKKLVLEKRNRKFWSEGERRGCRQPPKAIRVCWHREANSPVTGVAKMVCRRLNLTVAVHAKKLGPTSKGGKPGAELGQPQGSPVFCLPYSPF